MKAENETLQIMCNKAFYVWHEKFLKNPDGSVNSSPQPLAFICNVDIIKLCSGELFAGFVTDQGYLYCWIWNQEINERNDIKINPIAITNIEEYVCDLSCGSNHFSCFTENNNLYIWTFSLSEKRNINTEDLKKPVIIKSWESSISKIISGYNHLLVLLSNNKLYYIKIDENFEFRNNLKNEMKPIYLDELTDKIIEIGAGENVSACLSESNTIYYWYFTKDTFFDGKNDKPIIENIQISTILDNHDCAEDNCNYNIRNISILKDSIAIGVIFDCEIKRVDFDFSNEFTHIYLCSLHNKISTLVKRTDINNMFKSFHWLYEYICAIFVDDTIWFRNTKISGGELSDIVIRPKGGTKLSYASANGRCLIINITQNCSDDNTIVCNNSNMLSNSNDSNFFKTEVNEENDEENKILKEELNVDITEQAIPSNTTLETSDQEYQSLKKEKKDIFQLDSSTKIDEEPSYSKPTVSSIMTAKTKVSYSFLRKGEGKIKYLRNNGNSDKLDSNLSSNSVSSKTEKVNSILSNSATKSIHRKKLCEYEKKIFDLERENKRVLKMLDETNQQYFKDMKSLYNQLKEKSDEKFPLKSVIEQLQRELFIEREEKNKFRNEFESIKLKFQNELNNKNFRKELLNTQLILERDKLVKENEEKKAQCNELNKRCVTLEILLDELNIKYNKLQEERERLFQKYNEMDQNHTEAVNQLSKSELEVYELKKELDSFKLSNTQSICVNELYEYIDELEQNIKDLKVNCNRDQLSHENKLNNSRKNSNDCVDHALSNFEENENKFSNDKKQIKEYLEQKIRIFGELNYEDIQFFDEDQNFDSEICKLISELMGILTKKISDLNLKNRALEKKVSILERCIKTRRDDVSALVENGKQEN